MSRAARSVLRNPGQFDRSMGVLVHKGWVSVASLSLESQRKPEAIMQALQRLGVQVASPHPVDGSRGRWIRAGDARVMLATRNAKKPAPPRACPSREE